MVRYITEVDFSGFDKESKNNLGDMWEEDIEGTSSYIHRLLDEQLHVKFEAYYDTSNRVKPVPYCEDSYVAHVKDKNGNEKFEITIRGCRYNTAELVVFEVEKDDIIYDGEFFIPEDLNDLIETANRKFEECERICRGI